MQDILCTPIHPLQPRSNPSRFGTRQAAQALAFHRRLEGYAPTPLLSLSCLGERLGMDRLWIKDESKRFDLNAFKVLGGSYALSKAAEGRAGRLTFVTATDGNHGRGVAWAARRLGHEAHVYLPRGTAQERLKNIQRLGAHAELLPMNYDDAVRHAARMAQEHGWILIQDTSWNGYEEIPLWIMQGYTTMGAEIAQQLGSETPTHVFLQAGVGSMAGAMTAFFADLYGDQKPVIVVVEPHKANCVYRTALANDGNLHACPGELDSIMAGLCCGEVCPLGWEMLRDHGNFAISCPDWISADGMRILGNPLGDDPRIVSGESGAVTAGLVAALMQNDACRKICQMIGLNASSRVLCISTEGDTDPLHYRDVVWFGRHRRADFLI